MCRSVGDATEELFGVVSRVYDSKTIDMGEDGFRAVIASDGLFDIASNHSVLYETYADAETIAKEALQRRQKEITMLCEEAKIKDIPVIKHFDDNVSIIYVKIPGLHELKTTDVTSAPKLGAATKEDLQAKLSEAQELFGRFSHLMKDLEPSAESAAKAATPTMATSAKKPPAAKKSIEKRNPAPTTRKQSLKREVRKVQKDGVTVNFVRRASRERKS